MKVASPVREGAVGKGPQPEAPRRRPTSRTLTDAQIAAFVLDPAEHSEVRVHSMAEWEEMMTPRNFARLRVIDAARRDGRVAYLETP